MFRLNQSLGVGLVKHFKLDLNATVIAPSQKIWIVHPGRNREHFETFERENCIFLEFPDLNLTHEIVSNDDLLRQRIRYSQAIRASRGPVRQDGTTINLTSFPGTPGDDTSVYLRTIKHLASRMGQGDLVVVPGRSAQGRVLFGEVEGDFFPQQSIRPRGMDYAEVPVRRVRWLSTDRQKLDLPPSLIKYFEKPPAISAVRRDAVTERFFDFAYEAYIGSSSSYVSLSAPKYDGHDFLSIVPPAQLIALAVSIYKAQTEGHSIAGLSYDAIIAKYYDESIFRDAQMKFASPGRYNFKDKDRVLSQFVSAFVALAMAGMLTACGSGTGTVEVSNSKAPNSEITPAVQMMIDQTHKDAGATVLQKAEDQAKLSHAKMALKAPAKEG